MRFRRDVPPAGVMTTVVASLALLAFTAPLAALDPGKAITQYMHDVWQTEEGLPQSTVRAIAQTSDGYLWLGTQEGLVRFDGVGFTVFDKKNTPELTDHYILSLLEDRSGRLWAGTNAGGLLSITNGRFRHFSIDEGVPDGQVRALLEDRNGRLWVGTTEGLVWLDGERFRTEPSLEGLSTRRVLSLLESRDGSLWIGTSGGGLNRFRNGEVSTMTTAGGLANDIVLSLLESQDGSLWIGTSGGGLNRLRNGEFSTITIVDGLTNDVVRALLEDGDGNLWIGTWGGGLHRLYGDELTAITTGEELSHDRVIALYEDREGSLWIGTDGGGLNRLRDGKLTTITTREGLSSDIVLSLYEDREGSLWIGTSGGGLNQVVEGEVTAITTADGLTNDIVTALVEDRQGSLWIGTVGGGLNRLRAGRLTAMTTREGLTSNSVRALLEDQSGVLWIGTNGGGVNRLEEGQLTAITTADGLTNDRVRALLEDREGTLWIGTDGGGVSRFRDGELTAITTADGLSSDRVRALLEDREGSLWIGTAGGGLNRFREGNITTITSREGLFDDVVFQILEDDSGDLWMSCNKGIFRVAKRELDDLSAGKAERVTSVAYGTADGMKSAECNGGTQPAGWKTRDGRLLFPTIRGVVVVDPDDLEINDIAPPVVIEKMLVDEVLVDRGADLSLTPATEKLELHYAALSLVAPQRNRFKYRLEGYDSDWVDAGSRRAAYYTNLPHGNYTFRVIAANNDGIWNEEGASLSFAIEPHFYEKWWFRLLLVIAVVAALLSGYRARTRYLRAKARRLKLIVEERTKELRRALDEAEAERIRAEEANRAKSIFLANMSHELRTPLNGILGFAQIMDRNASRDPEDRQHLATILRCGDTLLDLINDVLSLSKIEAGRIALERDVFDLEKLLRGLDEMLRIRAESKDLTLTTKIDSGIPNLVVGDEARLRQILTNLLGNSIKFTEKGGVTLRTHWAEGRGVFEVEDTGPGIVPVELDGLFDPFVQTESGRSAKEGTGLGLAISRNLARLMEGDITATSEPGRGSCFRVEIALPEPAGDARERERGVRESKRVVGLTADQPDYRILVADDRADNRLLLVKLLRSVGFEVREVPDGEEAVEAWREWHPHLIWMDKRMPRMNGIEATRVIRDEERARDDGRVVIIALSASALEHERGDIVAAGCDDFLPKPFREEAIFSKMAEHLSLTYVYES